MANFLFGQPVLPARPKADSVKQVFVLGAYPSALHVRWTYNEKELIKAVAIDNEPEPFWTGADQEERIAAWKEKVKWDGRWGRVQACANLNGPSGAWVEEKVLDVLGVKRTDAWITDCIDTYFQSGKAESKIEDVKRSNVFDVSPIWPSLAKHPSENDIVNGAQSDRLRVELAIAKPALIVTLGNAALRVCRTELIQPIDKVPAKLSIEDYGMKFRVKLKKANGIDHYAELLPLAHPAAPKVYQAAHAKWMQKVRSLEVISKIAA